MTVILLLVLEFMRAADLADMACTEQTVNDASANPSGESAPIIGMGAEYPQLLEVTERLNENVAQLHRSVCLFMGQAWKKVPALPSVACKSLTRAQGLIAFHHVSSPRARACEESTGSLR